ncbi:DUF2911 domain-containing protein [Galbibacter pacificus]|uniref:DUF2911 domain-containing protein n=1 Tax=Galbibacter pacificus TaxID=2996052 RepID=A0ABT6FQ29_9FLAO|nr:DUF2911 domain-containing protein [Galbibacter pacificus]MDG3582148.1 DUF2911 domain-containing protein [Galbibacter pacificus]MDG3585376.1 DUF2911 domain-containing protein [Galbibacter pacificus]
MKRLILAVCVAFVSYLAEAQIQTPQPSPKSKLEQKVGLTDVTVEYSRPSMRERVIFGDLVPYGQVWRTGANQNTIITFSDDVKVGGTQLKKGSYALYTKPGQDNWEVYFYNDTNNWGNPEKWDESKVVAKVSAEAYELPFDVETFTIDVDNLTNNGASFGIFWEKTYVSVPFEVPTVEKTQANIEKVMNGPNAGDYYAAAVYYLQEDKDLDKAEEWIDKAVSMQKEPPFWMLRQKSLIQAKNGDTKGAIETAKQSMAAAEKAGNQDYVKLNQKSLEEWGAM